MSGIAYDSAEANEQLNNNTPDAAILDINPGSEEDGIEIAAQLNEKYNIPFLFLTSYADKNTLDRAKAVKPSGYIVKPFNEKTLLASLQIAISNHAAENNHNLPPLNMNKLNQHLIAPLSDREFDLSQCLYDGITNTQIAEKLFISVNTVKTHLKSIYIKLDANSRLEVIKRLREMMLK